MPLVDATHVRCAVCHQTYAPTFTKSDAHVIATSPCSCGAREFFQWTSYPYPQGSVGQQQTALMAQIAPGVGVTRAS